MKIHVPLRSRRRQRALVVQKIQHVVPAIPLLAAGFHAFGEGARGGALVLAVFEVATSVMLLGTVVRELRTLRRPDPHAGHSSHGVDWFHIFAAAVLLAETGEHWHLTHHWARPTIAMAAITLALGLLHGRLQRLSDSHRSLRLDADGIFIGGRFWSAFRSTWPDLHSIDIGERYAVIRSRRGHERRLDLADCDDPVPVRAALEQARARALGEVPPDPRDA